jgi:hypothetical protein
MAIISNAMLLCASSPYAQRGALFDAFKRHYGKDGDVLIWKAPTRAMNPTVPQSVVDAAMEADPASAASEYGASFRFDIESFVGREAVEAAVIRGCFELPRVEGVRYHAFTDPSGGSSDSMTLAVAHLKGNRVIVDCVRERRAPFSPDGVVEEFADALKSYGISKVVGDRYGGEWPRERFKVHGIEYRVADKVKSDLYLALLPLLNSGRIELLDHQRLINQLIGLERRTSRAGKDSIDHQPGAHDDVCNSVAGAVVLAAQAAAHHKPPIVSPQVFSNGRWWDAPPATGRQPTTTELFYRHGGGSRWPGSGPREW